MGWGVCFALDANGRVYCADGCKWRASKSDYDGYPVWPSARQSVLDYFEGEGHSELDMIRDECPGTSSALAAACDEHMAYALGNYESFTDDEKTKMHKEYLSNLESTLKTTEEKKSTMYNRYIESRKAFNSYKASTSVCKTRHEELKRELEPLNLELNMEECAWQYDMLKAEVTRVKKEIKLEKMFHL